MARGKSGGAGKKQDPATAAFVNGLAQVSAHPLFGHLVGNLRILREKGNYCPADGWAVAVDVGELHVHATRRAQPEEWAYVIAHALLHYALGHFVVREDPRAWNGAACAHAARFLAGMKFGRPPLELVPPDDLAAIAGSSESVAYAALRDDTIPGYGISARGLSLAGEREGDLWFAQGRSHRPDVDWSQAFSAALRGAVNDAVLRAGGVLEKRAGVDSAGQRARRWLIDHYPLLGSLALAFEVIEDQRVLAGLGIGLGAVEASARRIYLDGRRMSDLECRFVLAHEILHAGLRHQARCGGRDPFLWNVACDYVINGWLVEMGVGEVPRSGVLLDPELKGLSAEQIYDRIARDLRSARKLATLRGAGVGDILDGAHATWWARGEGMTLDEFYKSALVNGLAYHQDGGRGFLPAGLVEEIRALAQPPIPWDVELARWFDRYFSPVDRRRSYARPSRRQSSTPDIPRPSIVTTEGALEGRTFGVVIDTSGSMEVKELAKALGAVASYAISREVPAVRVVFCDAAAYDEGYLPAEDLLGRVRVKGRGGTILQPGIDLLERASDFPKEGPILVITDGECDRFTTVGGRACAVLLPEGRHLPFTPRGPIFRMGRSE